MPFFINRIFAIIKIMKIFSENRKAKFNYSILENFEAGIVLTGREVKSIREGKISLLGSYVVIRNEEIFLINTDISPYQPKNALSYYNPKRDRKLLLNKKEIKELIGKTKEKGLTLVPLKVYNKGAIIKIGLGLAKGKKTKDKRESIKKRDIERDIKRGL